MFERQASIIARSGRGATSAACPREYDQATRLFKSSNKPRRGKLVCGRMDTLQRAVESAWDGKCRKARRLIGRAQCTRWTGR